MAFIRLTALALVVATMMMVSTLAMVEPTPIFNIKQTECRDQELSIHSVSARWYYGHLGEKQEPIVLTGCFPSVKDVDYKLTIGSSSAVISTIEPTKLVFRPPVVTKTTLDMDLILTYTATIPATVTLNKELSAFVPVFNYITPYTVPLVPGFSEMRVSLTGIPPGKTDIQILFGAVKVEIVQRQNSFLILRLPANFPSLVTDSHFYDINIDDVLTIPSGVSLYHPSLNYNRYVVKSSPSWLPLGDDDDDEDRLLTLHGNGLTGAQSLVLSHPWSHEQLTFPLDTATSNDDDTTVTFALPTFSWDDANVFPSFNASKYVDQYAYRGPVWYDVLDSKGQFITSGEITFIPAPKPRFLVPSDTIPINYGAVIGEPIPDDAVSISAYAYDFPMDVPVRIQYADKWILTRERETVVNQDVHDVTVGHFGATFKLFHFPLPACKDCKTPFSAQLCLLSESDTNCLVDLGALTYSAPQESKKPTIAKTYPGAVFFEDFSTYIDSYFYSFPDEDTLRRLTYQHKQTGFLLEFDWEKENDHTYHSLLPKKCARPGVCPEGAYLPVLFDSELPSKKPLDIYTTPLALLTLAFNREDAYIVRLPTSFPYEDRAARDFVMDTVLTGLHHNYNDLENILPFNITAHATGPGSIVNFLIRPNSTQAQTTPAAWIEQFKFDLTNPDSGIRYDVPQITGDEATYTKVNYCDTTVSYIDGPCPKPDPKPDPTPKKPFPKWVVYAGIAVVSLLVLVLIVVLVKTETSCIKKRQKQHDRDEMLLSDDNSYAQIQ